MSCITIRLGSGDLDKQSPGYQAPEEYSGNSLASFWYMFVWLKVMKGNHVDSSFYAERRRGRGRGGFRGGRGSLHIALLYVETLKCSSCLCFRY